MTDPKSSIRRYAAECLQRAFDSLDAFEAARLSLHKQAAERGLEGALRDVQCHLCEDGRTVLLFAEYDSDDPLRAAFMLPSVTSEDDFNQDFYVSRLGGGRSGGEDLSA